ncbi:MAG TPA: phage tail protein [Candidatus Limnocylindrales bacterium]|jgi:microcystin-dependent protein|nr:phage tail protein [Candidatus Limnocylindrales bacterium]
MKKFFALVLGILALHSTRAQTVPSLMNYQGRLTDETGRALTNGTYGIQFRLWNKPVAGQPDETLVWGQQYDVSLVNGVFNVILGASGGAPLPGAGVADLQFAFGEPERYLGLTLVRLSDGTVISEAQRKEILPRQQLLSAPYAVEAGRAHSLVNDLSEALCPPGTILPFGGSAVPPGWFLCDGQQYSRTTYARLFAAIATSWGQGDGIGTFNVPDLRGVFLRGVNGNRNDTYADPSPNYPERNNALPGGSTGNQVGSYQADQFGSHNHDVWGMAFNSNAWGTGPNTENPLNNNGLLAAWEPNPGAQSLNWYGTTHQGHPYLRESGGNESRPRNAYVNYIIKY